MTQQQLIPGLAGVPAAESAISFIDGQAGILAYRGHRIEVLAEKSNFEETSWLLWYGTLPTRAELDGWRRRLAEARQLPDSIYDYIRALPKDGHPMEALQASLAVLGMTGGTVDLKDAASRDAACVRVLAAIPLLVAAFDRHQNGQEFVKPDADLSTAANFLWCLNDRKPSPIEERILDCALILHAEHTMNASTFACRVVASTETGPYTATSGAVGCLYGPLHGGANERVLRQLREISGPEAVEAWFDAKMAKKEKVMGLGHRVYKTKDPRANNLQLLARELFESHGSTPLYDIALTIEQLAAERMGDRGIWPNVDFFSGIVYDKLGIPSDVFTPIFAIARTAGWLAHWREQMEDNKLFRPGQIYTGVHDATWVDLDAR